MYGLGLILDYLRIRKRMWRMVHMDPQEKQICDTWKLTIQTGPNKHNCTILVILVVPNLPHESFVVPLWSFYLALSDQVQ